MYCCRSYPAERPRFRAALLGLGVMLALTACRGGAAGDGIEAAGASSAPAPAEECSWCPAAPDPDGAAEAGGPGTPPPDLMALLASTAAGAPFARLAEEDLNADIGEVCRAWTPGSSPEEAAAEASRNRAGRMDPAPSAAGADLYAQVLATAAERRCPPNTPG